MTLTLLIIRHAKSSWEDPFADDHARVLNGRGRRSADALGDWLNGSGYVPDTCLCSDAARTVETWGRIAARLDAPPSVRYRAPLYHAPVGTILSELQSAGHGRATAIVGHNPGIGDFAALMCAEAPAHPDFHRYPTGASTVLSFDADEWQNARPQKGRALGFVVPRDL